MTKLDNAIEQLEEIVLSEDNDILTNVYCTINSEMEKLKEHIHTLMQEKADLEKELNERKVTMWNDNNYRKQIVRQILAV